MTCRKLYINDPYILGTPVKKCRVLGIPVLPSPLPCLQPARTRTREYSLRAFTHVNILSLCNKCRASNYAPFFFFLRFEIGCGQAGDLSSDQIAVLCSRVGGCSLFCPTNTVCQSSPLFRRACGRSEKLAMLKRKASRQDVTKNIC